MNYSDSELTQSKSWICENCKFWKFTHQVWGICSYITNGYNPHIAEILVISDDPKTEVQLETDREFSCILFKEN